MDGPGGGERPFERRSDLLGALDELAVPVEAGGEPLVVADAERHPLGAPPSVVHHDGHDREPEPGGGVELHGVEPERAVADDPDHLRAGPGQRGGERVADPVADVAEVAHARHPPGWYGGERGAGPDHAVRPRRRRRSRHGRAALGAPGTAAWGASGPARSSPSSALPGGDRGGLVVEAGPPLVDPQRLDGVGELAERGAGVGDDPDADRHPVAADLERVDVDLDEVVEVREPPVAEEVVELLADAEEHVGLVARRSASR